MTRESLKPATGAGLTLLRDWGGADLERHDRDDPEEFAFYGAYVSEGICPDLHDENDLVDDGSHDRRPRMLVPRADGWLRCEDGHAWRFINA